MAIGITLSFADEAGKEATMQANVVSGATAADAARAAQRLALLVDPITDAKITGISLTLPASLPAGLKTDPVDGARVGVGAKFNWVTSGNHATRFIVPARIESIIIDGTDVVNIADDDVDALIAEVTAGLDIGGALGGTGTVAMHDTRNEDIVSLDEAYETIGGKRR